MSRRESDKIFKNRLVTQYIPQQTDLVMGEILFYTKSLYDASIHSGDSVFVRIIYQKRCRQMTLYIVNWCLLSIWDMSLLLELNCLLSFTDILIVQSDTTEIGNSWNSYRKAWTIRFFIFSLRDFDHVGSLAPKTLCRNVIIDHAHRIKTLALPRALYDSQNCLRFSRTGLRWRYLCLI